MTSWMDIQVFCTQAAYPFFLRPRNFSYVPAERDYSPPDVPAQYIEYPALPLVSRPFNGLVYARYVLPHLRRFQPDLILSYYAYPDGYAALSAGKRLGVPVVLGAIGSDINRVPDRISAFLTRKALRGADFVLAVSEHLRQQAIRLGASPERSRTVRNGCDTSVFHSADRAEARAELGQDAETEIVVFVGWIAHTKGLRELIEAVIRLRPSHPRLNLFCVGEGPLQGELESRAAEADATDQDSISREAQFDGGRKMAGCRKPLLSSELRRGLPEFGGRGSELRPSSGGDQCRRHSRARGHGFRHSHRASQSVGACGRSE